jgi:hypothetical protein
MPGDWGRMGEFRKLLLLRALRPDRITNALQVGVTGLFVCWCIYLGCACVLPGALL